MTRIRLRAETTPLPSLRRATIGDSARTACLKWDDPSEEEEGGEQGKQIDPKLADEPDSKKMRCAEYESSGAGGIHERLETHESRPGRVPHAVPRRHDVLVKASHLDRDDGQPHQDRAQKEKPDSSDYRHFLILGARGAAGHRSERRDAAFSSATASLRM